MKKYFVGLAILIALLLIGFFVPLGSYTTADGCPTNPTPKARLQLIKGETLNKVKNRKNPVGPGCTVNTKFTLYLL